MQCSSQNLLVTPVVISVNAVRNALFHKQIEDRLGLGNSSWSVDVATLQKIKPGKEARAQAALEVTPHAEQMSPHLLHELSRHAVVHEAVGQEVEVAQPAKR